MYMKNETKKPILFPLPVIKEGARWFSANPGQIINVPEEAVEIGLKHGMVKKKENNKSEIKPEVKTEVSKEEPKEKSQEKPKKVIKKKTKKKSVFSRK